MAFSLRFKLPVVRGRSDIPLLGGDTKRAARQYILTYPGTFLLTPVISSKPGHRFTYQPIKISLNLGSAHVLTRGGGG